MFGKKEMIYFVDPTGKILEKRKKLSTIPRKGEIIVFNSTNKKYNVMELVHTIDKNSHVCWVYLNDFC